MKTTSEFKAAVYEKHEARLAARNRAKRRALLCAPLAAVVLAAGGLALPRLLPSQNGGGLYTLRAGPAALRDLSTSGAWASITDENGNVDERAYDQIDWDGMRAQWEQNVVDPEFPRAVNDFARDSTVLLSQDFQENACYSPLSLYYALAMLGSGAENGTREEFQQALHVTDMDWAAEQCGKFYRQRYRDNPLSKFRLANSLWLDDRCDFNDPFLKGAEENFYASLFTADFTDPALGGEISGWIAENTENLLNPVLDFGPDTLLALVNTVYLQDQWSDKFSQELNTREDFTKADGSAVTAEFMHREDEFGNVFLGDGFTRASLRLKETGEMVFILPDEGVSAADLLRDPQAFEKMFYPKGQEDLETCKVVWSVPKFSFDAKFADSLINALEGMGLGSAMDPFAADFSKISDKQSLYLSQAEQGVHIGIDEDGVMAAAYTVLYAEAGGALPQELKTVEMNLNRPFLFAILSSDATTAEDSAGTLLFVGICGEPDC